jgi:O-methyltransferase
MGIFPDETIESLPNKIRLCHVDVDTYGSAKACLETVWPRLSVGGMIIFDDYGFWGCEGVTDLLNLESPNNSILIHNINGHGILIKVQLGVT